MDGIDVALLQTDGHSRLTRLAGRSYGYDEPFRALLRQALVDARDLVDRAARPGCLGEVETQVTRRHGEAVARFLRDHGIAAGEIDIIGFHGQTVLHERRSPQIEDVHEPQQGLDVPPQKEGPRPDMLSVQLGDGAELARQTGIDVVYDFRAADCAGGGEGAPLVPVYHQALAAKLPQRPIAFVNIGGVANITYVGFDGRLVAFDCGPGNALIDDWVLQHSGDRQDTDGALAASGTVSKSVLQALMRNKYFARPAPKSLDRNSFSLAAIADLGFVDGAATLTAWTALTIAESVAIFPTEPELWIICGGGRRNRTMMHMIAEQVNNAVVPAEAVHLDGDTLESEAFAFLAVRALEGLPLTFPSTTGVSAPTCGGVLANAVRH